METPVRELSISLTKRGVTLDLPKHYAIHIKQYLEAEYVILTFGDFEGTRSCEILFEDHNDAPRALRAVLPSQVKENHQFEDMEKTVLQLLCEGTPRGELPAYIRYRETLPCMEKI